MSSSGSTMQISSQSLRASYSSLRSLKNKKKSASPDSWNKPVRRVLLSLIQVVQLESSSVIRSESSSFLAVQESKMTAAPSILGLKKSVNLSICSMSAMMFWRNKSFAYPWSQPSGTSSIGSSMGSASSSVSFSTSPSKAAYQSLMRVSNSSLDSSSFPSTMQRSSMISDRAWVSRSS